jgi:phosphate transport system substrate-binding protein
VADKKPFLFLKFINHQGSHPTADMYFSAKRGGSMFAILLCITLLANCSAVSSSDKTKLPPGSISLTGGGSTFSSVLFNRWFKVYHDNHPNTFMKYASVGSGEGVRRFIGKNIAEDDQVDFGASDSAMSDAEIAQTNNDTLMVPVTAGCVVLAYNLSGVHSGLKLSRKAYAGIFLGEVKNWNDPLIAQSNPDLNLPDLAIATVVRLDSSGTTFAFTGNLAAIDDKWRDKFGQATLVDWPGDAMRGKGNEGVASLIQHSRGSIGFVGLEFARQLTLDTAALENKEGKVVRPSEQSCAAGLATAELPDNLRVFVPDPSGAEAYPIVTLSWVLLRRTYKDPQTAIALRDLFRWCLRDGQQYASQVGYVPVPASVAEKALFALNKINSGG